MTKLALPIRLQLGFPEPSEDFDNQFFVLPELLSYDFYVVQIAEQEFL
jgi:hypothetical protein